MKNTIINKFNIDLVQCINNYLAKGVDISTVVICLDKCLANARLLEIEVLKEEQIKNQTPDLNTNIPHDPDREGK